MREAHELRDQMLETSHAAREASEMASFGSVLQSLGQHAVGLTDELPDVWAPQFKPEVDQEIFPRLMCMGAKASMDTFRSLLDHCCPPDDARYKLLVGPIKKPARIAVKVREYNKENDGDPTKWPFICQVRTVAISHLCGALIMIACACHRSATCSASPSCATTAIRTASLCSG